MKYIPQLHWENKSKWYLKNPTKKQNHYKTKLVQIITHQIQKHQPETLLEIGVGVGRLFSAYGNLLNVTGIDFSEGMLKRAEQEAKRIGIPILLHQMGADSLVFIDNSFDMVICSNVLQHIPHELIGKCTEEIMRVCNRVLVVVDYYEHTANRLSEFCFLHDYPKLFEKMKLIENKKIRFEKQRLFVFEKVKV